jgi:hypothetical protein
MIARQQQPAAVRNLNPAYVRFGSMLLKKSSMISPNACDGAF